MKEIFVMAFAAYCAAKGLSQEDADRVWLVIRRTEIGGLTHPSVAMRLFDEEINKIRDARNVRTNAFNEPMMSEDDPESSNYWSDGVIDPDKKSKTGE